MSLLNPDTLIKAALAEARVAYAAGEVPVGAVLVGPEGEVLAKAHNRTERDGNPLAHAEMLAIYEALAKRTDKYLTDCTLAVTLEPCPLCMAALCHVRIGKVIFGAYDPKSGGTVNGPRVGDFMHHKPEVLGGIGEEACSGLLKDFFSSIRHCEERPR